MLLIIDMQRIYDASDFIIPNVCKHIQAAKNRNEIIVLVEYRCSACNNNNKKCYNYNTYTKASACDTHPEILDLLKDYSKLITVQKDDDDGSDKLIQEVTKWKKIVKVCGVNTDACVRSTVNGLIKLLPLTKFVLLLDAVNDDYYGQERAGLEWTKKYSNQKRKNRLTVQQKHAKLYK